MASHRFLISSLGIACLLTVCPSRLQAEQFVLFDATFTYTKEDADNSKPSKSHYYLKGDMINPDRPKDWTQPIDYRNGTIHIRTEVIEKPAGGEPTTWTICYIPNKGQKNGYGCTGTVLFRDVGFTNKMFQCDPFGKTIPSCGPKASSRWTWSSKTAVAGQDMPTSEQTTRSSSPQKCG